MRLPRTTTLRSDWEEDRSQKAGGQESEFRIADWFESQGKLLNSECRILPLGVRHLRGVGFRIPQIRNPKSEILPRVIYGLSERQLPET
jgi:hypothetical protein